MIFQEPTTSLNPYLKVGDHITETLAFHGHADEDRRELRERALGIARRRRYFRSDRAPRVSARVLPAA